jgi:hypothetical protein
LPDSNLIRGIAQQRVSVCEPQRGLESIMQISSFKNLPVTMPGAADLSTLFIFPYYQTREQFREQTGDEPPPWNPEQPPKYWRDPAALNSPRRNVVYDNVLAVNAAGRAIPDQNGRPQLETMVLTKEHAAAVNIPPKGPGSNNVPGAAVPEVQVPLRELRPNEMLVLTFSGAAGVFDTTKVPETPTSFTHDDRRLLEAIAAKLGVV